MSFLNSLTAFLPFGKKEEQKEYFFALNIATEKLTAALWFIAGKQLKVSDIASARYSSNEEIASVADKLLDSVIGLKEIEPRKILFGVPNSWLVDENLKDEYLKILRGLVKELELVPMAYVATSHALINFMEHQEGVPTTAIMIGFEELHLTVAVVRAGKLDGVKIISRGESAGVDIEKVLLTFADVETLPSKILIYGPAAAGLKSHLLSFSWMSKLSFLHIPKIEVLEEDLEIKSVCLAGGSEIDSNIKFTEGPIQQTTIKSSLMPQEPEEEEVRKDSEKFESQDIDNLGFVVGDVEKQVGVPKEKEDMEESNLTIPEETSVEVDDFEKEIAASQKFNFKKFIPKRLKLPKGIMLYGIGVIILAGLLFGASAFFSKANVKVFVEPKVLEKDATVTADPNQKTVNEDAKIIPGQIVNVDISGSGKDSPSGKKQIGDPAKGTVKVYNATDQQITLKAGQTMITDSGIQFKLDKAVNIASKSAGAASPPTVSDPVGATAVSIGGDGNIPSAMELKVGNYSKADVEAKSEGNFSGGTSKDVTVVSTEDQQRLLAKVSSDLRGQAQQKLQEKYPTKKILQEALSENISKKSFNKNVNDQASDFSLNLTVNYKGTAFDDVDLRTIVSMLVNTQVPDNFTLDLSTTETQADVSKLEKDGRLIFLAKFKAKLMPKIDTDKIRSQIKFKTLQQAADYIKSLDSVLGSEIKISPNLPLPTILTRLPILGSNISIEAGLK